MGFPRLSPPVGESEESFSARLRVAIAEDQAMLWLRAYDDACIQFVMRKEYLG